MGNRSPIRLDLHQLAFLRQIECPTGLRELGGGSVVQKVEDFGARHTVEIGGSRQRVGTHVAPHEPIAKAHLRHRTLQIQAVDAIARWTKNDGLQKLRFRLSGIKRVDELRLRLRIY